MYSPPDDAALPAPGFPIRRSAGQRLFSASPRLIAAVHVLHRLLVPRHPPCALLILTVSSPGVRVRAGWFITHNYWPCAVFKVHRGARGGVLPPGGLSKLSSVPGGAWPPASPVDVLGLPRKEVIQPQLPLRLPCYDFTPITSPTFDGSLLAVRPPASGVACFRGVTGGVYKARERIHRGIADPRLLATPTSWRRVSASNPNRDALFGIRSTSRYCNPLYAPM